MTEQPAPPPPATALPAHLAGPRNDIQARVDAMTPEQRVSLELASQLLDAQARLAAALTRAEAAEARLAQLTAATNATFHPNGVITFAPPNPEPFEVAVADELARRLAAEARLAAVTAQRDAFMVGTAELLAAGDALAESFEHFAGAWKAKRAALGAARPATEGDADG